MAIDKEGTEENFNLYYDDFGLYMMKIIKETIARQLASYYNYGLLVHGHSLKQYLGSIGIMFNYTFEFEDIREEVEQILKSKYNLIIVNDKPLVIKDYKK